MRLLSTLLLFSLLFVCLVFGSVVDKNVFNPHHRRHAVSRSTFHTKQGRVYDNHRAYPGQGESHTRNALEPYEFSVDEGHHLWDSDVYAKMSSLALESFNSTQYLTSLEDAANAVPEQVKLSVTQRAGEMVVNWLTWASSPAPTVWYGFESGSYQTQVKANTITFVDPNTQHLIRYIHNALLTDLPASRKVYYAVGDPNLNVWSDELVMLSGGNGSTIQTIGIFGDMGVVNSQSMQLLSDEVATGEISMVLHLGDYAYNMDELQGMTGDVFLEEMQNITSAVPYMGAPGNHEQAFNFSHYANKFSLYNYISDPAGKPDQNWWYSWDFQSGGSNIHVMTLDSELYYWDYLKATPEQATNYPRMIEAQWNWIVADLTAAYDSGKYDWIIAYAHRPLYCSNIDDIDDCTSDTELLRKGYPTGPNGTYQWGFESALSVRPLDIYFAAHEHSYERTLPVHNGVIDFQKDTSMYVDPLYPTHIISGAGGCREYYDYYDEVFYGAWSVLRSSTYGYGHLTVHNATHLYWEQLLDEGHGGKDTLWIVKQKKEKNTFKDETEESTEDAVQPIPILDEGTPKIALE